MVWEQTTWFLIGAVALLFTSVSLLGLRERVVPLFIADAAAVLLWTVWAIQAFAVELTTEAGVVIMQHYPSLGYLGLVFALVMIIDLFSTVFEAMAIEFREAGR